jgi:small subunit ribosomal protein S19
MTRSKWKGPFVDSSLLKKFNLLKKNDNIVIWSRRSTVLPEFVGMIAHIYNGKKFFILKIKKTMVNFKFGDFSFTKTRSSDIHWGSLKKTKKNKKRN